MGEVPKSLHQVLGEMGHVVDGEFRWPIDPARRCEVARLMWGEALVGKLDYWIDYAADFVLNPEPSEPIAPAYQRKELHRRAVFASMTPEQREVVVDLLRENVMSLMFSTLVSIDQPPFMGEMQIRVLKREDEDDAEDDEPEELQIAPPIEGSDTMHDLHDELHPWVDLFSRHAEELVRRQRREGEAREALLYSEPGKDASGKPLSDDEAKQQKQIQGMAAALRDSMQELRENPGNRKTAEANFMERVEKIQREMLEEE